MWKLVMQSLQLQRSLTSNSAIGILCHFFSNKGEPFCEGTEGDEGENEDQGRVPSEVVTGYLMEIIVIIAPKRRNE